MERAREASANAGHDPADHFVAVNKMVDLGSGAQRRIEDVALTRGAAYLIAQNGDPKKEAVAFAQTYFAVQTRKQELIEARLVEIDRLEARRGLVASEKELGGVIFERLRESETFARIKSKGDAALFGGWTTRDMKKRMGETPDFVLRDERGECGVELAELFKVRRGGGRRRAPVSSSGKLSAVLFEHCVDRQSGGEQ